MAAYQDKIKSALETLGVYHTLDGLESTMMKATSKT